jgi:glutamate 5-kinase
MLTEVAEPADLAGVRLGRGGGTGIGRGGMASKVEAARVAAAAGTRAVVAGVGDVGPVLAGEPLGTTFTPASRRLPTRLLWLAYAATTRGALRLDDGAVYAVVTRRMSLLPAGVTAVEGDFVAGDPVDLLGQNGHVVARGLVNFDVAELPALLGRSTSDLGRELGPAFSREVVHRDDIVVL